MVMTATQNTDFCFSCCAKIGWIWPKKKTCENCNIDCCGCCSKISKVNAEKKGRFCRPCLKILEKNEGKFPETDTSDEKKEFTKETKEELYKKLQKKVSEIPDGTGKGSIEMVLIRSDEEKLLTLKYELFKLIEDRETLITELNMLADELDAHYIKICKAKVGGAVGSIGGGILCVVGFGLSFVTFGASLGLSIAGGIIAGGGGLTTAGSNIVDAVLVKNRKTQFEKKIKDYQEQLDIVLLLWKDIDVIMNKFGNVNDLFPEWFVFWGSIGYEIIKGTKCFGYDVVASTVVKALRIASYSDDIATSGTRVTTAAIKTLSPIHIAGGVVGIALMPLDIFSLVDSAYEVNKRNPHEVSVKMRKMAQEIGDIPINKDDIEQMITKCIFAIEQISQ